LIIILRKRELKLIDLECLQSKSATTGRVIELKNENKVFVDNPRNMEALAVMKKTTPARIAIGRCGTRYKTATLLDFLASHAAAQDAVELEVSDKFINHCELMKTKTKVFDKDEYLKKPALGRKLDDEPLISSWRPVELQIIFIKIRKPIR